MNHMDQNPIFLAFILAMISTFTRFRHRSALGHSENQQRRSLYHRKGVSS